MDDATLKALKASIAHWQRNLDAENWWDITTSSDSCALCRVFKDGYHSWNATCTGCPVSQSTGKPLCAGTPYLGAFRAAQMLINIVSRTHNKEDSETLWKEWRAAAQAELEFLKSLLPGGEP